MLVEVDMNEVFGPKGLSERAQYCEDVIREFISNRHQCDQLTEFESYGTYNQIASTLRARIKRHREWDGKVRIQTKQGQIYLINPGFTRPKTLANLGPK